jgi:Mg2+-importing ATPase
MLPMIVSVNLAKQAFRMSKQKTIVKNINSIQSFGAMDVLCTDKTGTLTEDRIVVERYINIGNKTDQRVLLYGYLNSYFQTGLKNLLDISIINKAKETNIDDQCNGFVKVDEIPFDFQRRKMSVVVKRKSNNERILITKGAPEEILSICSHVEYKKQIIPLSGKIINRIKSIITSLNKNGMRVIAIATNYGELETETFSTKDENNMTLVGLAAFLDPPKISAKKAILGLQRKGVQIKVLTGDNEIVTKYICSQVGINAKNILLGEQIESMSNDELKDRVVRANIFAKLSPEQKARVINAIKSNRHIVGYMGDGINDAAAMHEADIGISVDTAVDVAKESADIILLEKDLTILTQGTVEGRRTYANIIKYIKISVSSSFGNMISMLVASLWLPFQPMMAVQILILNLIYDFSQFMVP